MWKQKVDYFERYIEENECFAYGDWNYFIGLCENAINYAKSINYEKIKYGFVVKRFYNIDTLYDICNPLNLNFGPIVYSISEYIKYYYFYLNVETDISLLFSYELSCMDFQLLISRLLFPTYFFDIIIDNNDVCGYEKVLNRSAGYICYLKKIIETIKKRNIAIPLIEWIN